MVLKLPWFLKFFSIISVFKTRKNIKRRKDTYTRRNYYDSFFLFNKVDSLPQGLANSGPWAEFVPSLVFVWSAS